MCGDEPLIISILNEHASDWKSLPLQIQHAPEIITMDDDPSWSVKNKKNSSLVCTIKAVAQGRASAAISAGNSGAVLVAGIVHSGRVAEIHRPAIGSFIPTKTGTIFCMDLGANVDAKAEYLYQFGLMGAAYVSLVNAQENPRVALLSNGHEPYKGNAEVKKAYDLLSKSKLNFVGNVEARDLFEDRADVLVCDGFVGNVLLKSIQGMAQTLFWWLKEEVKKQSWLRQILFSFNSSLFNSIKKKTDYASIGGALLLGIQHPIVVAHGRSDERAIANGIQFAHQVVQEKRIEKFNIKLKEAIQEFDFSGSVVQKMRSFFGFYEP